MRIYEVIVGNVGSVYHGKNRAEAIATYGSTSDQPGTSSGLVATAKT